VTSTEKSVVITGAGKGIGQALVRECLAMGWTVHATCRRDDASEALARMAQDLPGRLESYQLDVTDAGAILSLGESLGDKPIDILINNAGTMGSPAADQEFGRCEGGDNWLEAFQVNAIAPLLILQALVRNLELGAEKKVINISSIVAQLEQPMLGGLYEYRSSKAALNAVTAGAAMDLKDKGIMVVSLHPGLVRTDMGGDYASTLPADAAIAILATVGKLQFDDSGKFFDPDGTELRW